MPSECRRAFISRQNPSIQIGLLAAVAEKAGHRADALHLNLDFVSMVGDETYDFVAEIRGPMTGDWLFSLAAFGERAPDPDATFLEHFSSEVQQLETATGGRLSRAHLS